ncbi:MAG: phosphomannomutase [Proteobacteria bacterium]|nr:phosphomannomutase [Pseudomonadota bacterium]
MEERKKLSCFKAYDIRGKVPEQLSPELAYKIGLSYAAELSPKQVVVGYDIRLESLELTEQLSCGLMDGGADVIDIGLCGTEEIYFATFHHGFDGGIMVTASHNPKGYNGMKLVKEASRPISGDTGLKAIEQRILDQQLPKVKKKGTRTEMCSKQAYLEHLLTYVDLKNLKPLKVVVNPGNGAAGPAIHGLSKLLPFEFVFIHDEPDGHFPNGVPNPLLVENRASTAQAVQEHNADFGVAWDGDFDRCFLFDANGDFIEGYYIVGLLSELLLQKNPGCSIIHDPRLTWNTISVVEALGGTCIQSKTGHAFIKERMRLEDAVYGGEMSAHHYFKRFAYCDSGMIPWLLVAELISTTGKTLEQLVSERMKAFPCSGEINFRVSDIPKTIKHIERYFEGNQPLIDRTDGVSMSFPEWRMNIRASNTEPLLRLNIESRGSEKLVQEKVQLLRELIGFNQ